MADGVWKGVYPKVFGRSRQLSLNKKRKKEKKIMSFLVATSVVASWPPKRRPTGTPQAAILICKVEHAITSQ